MNAVFAFIIIFFMYVVMAVLFYRICLKHHEWKGNPVLSFDQENCCAAAIFWPLTSPILLLVLITTQTIKFTNIAITKLSKGWL